MYVCVSGMGIMLPCNLFRSDRENVINGLCGEAGRQGDGCLRGPSAGTAGHIVSFRSAGGTRLVLTNSVKTRAEQPFWEQDGNRRSTKRNSVDGLRRIPYREMFWNDLLPANQLLGKSRPPGLAHDNPTIRDKPQTVKITYRPYKTLFG